MPKIRDKSSAGTLPPMRGMDAYELAVRQGFVGSLDDWIKSLKGEDGLNGLSTYEIAVANGFEGTETEWLKQQEPIPGRPGEPGPPGPRGPMGPMPRHEWNGTELRFQLAPDQWGQWVDLKGDKGDKGDGGGVVGGGPIRIFSTNLPGFVPAPGAGNTTKFLRGDATWQTVSGGGGSSFGYMPQGWA